MTSEPSTDRDVSVAPPADHGAGQITLLQRVASLRAWLFLGALLIFFEIWARVVYDSTFLGNTYNRQSLAVFAVPRVLLSTG